MLVGCIVQNVRYIGVQRRGLEFIGGEMSSHLGSYPHTVWDGFFEWFSVSLQHG